MIERFQGDEGGRRLVTSLTEHRLVGASEELASLLVSRGELIEVPTGVAFINQGDHATDVFFIIAGSAEVRVNGKVLAIRHAGDHVGEMSAIEPIQPRSATVIAQGTCVLLKLSEASFLEIANAHPAMWRRIAATLARRLEQRNRLVTAPRERVKVFIMSSVESIPVSNLMIQHFEHDPFLAIGWQHGVFKASHYTLDDLEEQLDDADFAIAIAHADDVVISREEQWPVVRDNVIFELGMFLGRLGRKRAFLMEQRDSNVKLPSDLTGLTTIPYRYVRGKDAMAEIAPACAKLRDLFLAEGPKD
jgi:predicted nucleotide-binding protein